MFDYSGIESITIDQILFEGILNLLKTIFAHKIHKKISRMRLARAVSLNPIYIHTQYIHIDTFIHTRIHTYIHTYK